MTKIKLQRLNIAYVELSLEEHPEELEKFKSRGLLSAPIVIPPESLVNKTNPELTAWSGFRPELLEKLGETITSSYARV